MSSRYTLVECPHCKLFVIVYIKDYNCKIFRHGIYKNDMTKQIDPHLPKVDCDKLKAEGKIFGCGKPFRLIQKDGIEKAIICDYI